MAKKIRNFAAILAVSAVVGTILLVLVFLLPVGPMRKNVEKSVGATFDCFDFYDELIKE